MIAIIEDDESIAGLEQYALQSSGLPSCVFPDGGAFFQWLTTQTPRLVILDVMLPDMDGHAILKRLRENPATRQIPVMMVTAKGSELDIVQGLDGGADDYLPKPFGIMEFLSRTKALLRRTAPDRSELKFGVITMSQARRQVFVEEQPVELTYKEYELLKLFLTSPNTVLTRDEMLDQVWQYKFTVESRTVDMHIRTLRQKLGVAGSYIQTLRKVGYILTLPDQEHVGEGPS